MQKYILFVHHCSTIGGASWCLVEILRHLDRDRFSPIVLLSHQGPLVDRIRLMGIPVQVEPRIPVFCVYGSIRPFLKSIVALLLRKNVFYRYCCEIKPDAVYLNTTAQLYLCREAKRAGVKRVVLHNRELWGTKGLWRIKHTIKNRIVHRCVDQILSITQAGIDQFGCSEKNRIARDWPSFDDETEVDIRSELGIATDKYIILLTGGFQSIKGTADMIRALDYMEHASAVEVIVLGCEEITLPLRKRMLLKVLNKSSYDQEVTSLADPRANVYLLPSTLQVKGVMQSCNVLVAPFTMPHAAKAALEAQLLGLPVVLYDSGPAQEYVKNGDTGFIVPIGNIEQLAAALDRLVEENGTSDQRAEEARRFIDTEFSAEKSMQIIHDSFSSV